MKNLTRTTLLSCFLLASASAFAGPEHSGHSRGEGSSNPMARELTGALRQLDLSEDQRAAIRTIMEENRDTVKAQSEARRANQEELLALMSSPDLDENALAALAEREGDLAEERIILTGTLMSDIQNELDETQLEELTALREERLARRGSHRGGRFAGKDSE